MYLIFFFEQLQYYIITKYKYKNLFSKYFTFNMKKQSVRLHMNIKESDDCVSHLMFRVVVVVLNLCNNLILLHKNQHYEKISQ